jgi:hypothetical protein
VKFMSFRVKMNFSAKMYLEIHLCECVQGPAVNFMSFRVKMCLEIHLREFQSRISGPKPARSPCRTGVFDFLEVARSGPGFCLHFLYHL